jgi:hypothetical protein
MRGAGRAAGRNFKTPKGKRSNAGEDLFNTFSPIGIYDLPVPPTLHPINDEWSISNLDDPVDAKDCAAYPASPYCDGDFLDIKPLGFKIEIRSNECETCIYTYPIIGFMVLQPTIVCKRDPNCDKKPPPINKDPITKNKPPRYNEDVPPDEYKSPGCAERESILNIWYNYTNDLTELSVSSKIEELQAYPGYTNLKISIEVGEKISGGGYPDPCIFRLESPFKVHNKPVVYRTVEDKTTEQIMYFRWKYTAGGNQYEEYAVFSYLSWSVGRCCGMEDRPPIPEIKPPPPPPPPPPQDDKKGKKKMCCNSCDDSADNTARLIREIKEIKKILGTGKLGKALDAAVGIGDDSITAIISNVSRRLGVSSYPITVPNSLLEGFGDENLKIQSNAEFLTWLTYQIDGLVGQFPVEIEVKDIDPLTEGDQTKSITLPNISEAIAEIYGLTIKSSVNQEIELNMLLRIAAEIIATKNAAVVTQDYARANANFLGYKANYKPRELQYNFDFSGANLDPKAKEPIVLEKLLKTVTGYVQGWHLEDKETVVGFLQKLMFSAGIIKAVFFRGKGQQKELKREIESMAKDEKEQEKKFEAFIKEINDPNSRFNRNTSEKPEMKGETPPDSKPKGGI